MLTRKERKRRRRERAAQAGGVRGLREWAARASGARGRRERGIMEGKKLHRLDSFFNISWQRNFSPSLSVPFTHEARSVRRRCQANVLVVVPDCPWCGIVCRGVRYMDSSRPGQCVEQHGARLAQRGCGFDCSGGAFVAVSEHPNQCRRRKRRWRRCHRHRCRRQKQRSACVPGTCHQRCEQE